MNDFLVYSDTSGSHASYLGRVSNVASEAEAIEHWNSVQRAEVNKRRKKLYKKQAVLVGKATRAGRVGDHDFTTPVPLNEDEPVKSNKKKLSKAEAEIAAKDEIIFLRERYNDLALADALDGIYATEADTRFAAAASMGDVDAMRKLISERERDTNFTQPAKVFPKGVPPLTKAEKKEKISPLGKREIKLTEHKGTRLYARKLLADNAKLDTPFD